MEKSIDQDGNSEAIDLDMSGIDHSIGFQLRRAQALVFQKFLSRFSSYDLRPTEFCTLVLISENPGRKQSEIAAALGELERRHLIERRNAPNDRRSNALYLTTRGSTFVAEIRKAEAAFEDECMEQLGGARARDQLLTLLAKLSG